MLRVAAYYHSGCGNRGCEAIVRSTSQLLRETFGELTLTLYSMNPAEDKAAGLPPEVEVTSWFPAQMPTMGGFSLDRLRLSFYARQSIEKSDEFFFRRMFEASDLPDHDLHLSIGGDTYCYGRVSDLAACNARLLDFPGGKRPVLWGCSIGSENLTDQKRADLRRYECITARESRTLSLLRDLGLEDRSFLHPDPAFLLHPDPVPLPEAFRPGKTVGLNLSPLAAQYAPEGLLLANARELLRTLLADPEASVALIPHVMQPGNDDRAPLRELKADWSEDPRVFLLGDPDGSEDGPAWTAPQLKYAISQCGIFLGARTHATIAAYSTGVPTLVLGYSVKSAGIAQDLFENPAGLVVAVKDLRSAGELRDAVLAFLPRTAELRGRLAEKLPDVLQQARLAGTRLQAACKG
ncbi:MAG: polysaccharide pyruvyl transferase family protein [Oscillospiraceae bacterium]|jgi:polysaccharide pyruvyl transferase WcaK-like protein|nr:polysaccharide pyruvyl transferase family protein [Oscillospiraceae bacterium]